MGQYFRLHGLTGFLLAVVLLLSILAFLTINAIAVQQSTASVPYTLDGQKLEMINVDNKASLVIDSNKE
jgi:hypothetical protein